MKTIFLSFFTIASLAAVSTQAGAQDISQDRVPSVVRNNFETAFPKATDIEWEKKGELYNVEFETGRNTDHEVWYDPSGKLVRHQEDISKKELPAAVTRMISRDYKGYRISDLEKITTDTSAVYRLELDSLTDEWQITVGQDGKIISKRAD